MCRILALNGDSREFGQWFANYGQTGIAELINQLSRIGDLSSIHSKMRNLRMNDPDVQLWRETKRYMQNMSSDEQAATRRVAIGFVNDDLISDSAVQTLRAEACAKAAAGRARRQAARKLEGV